MATSVNTPSATKVITSKVRLSYVHIWEAFSNTEGQDPKYSCVLLIPKSDKVTIAKLRAAQQAALDMVRPGLPHSAIHEAAVQVLAQGMLDL